MADRSSIDQSTRAVLASIFVVLAGSSPQLLAGPLAPSLERDLDVTPAMLGFAISLSALPALLFGVRGGTLVDRRGAASIGTLVCGFSFVVLVGLALATSSLMLVWVIALAGCTRAVLDATSSRFLTDWVPSARRTASFGAREASIPAVVLLASIVLPLLDGVVGWRGVVALFVVLPVAGAVAIAGLGTTGVDGERGPSVGVAPVLTLGFMVGVGLMFMAANVLNAFAVLSLERSGSARASTVVAAGALACVLARLVMARWASSSRPVDPRAVIGISASVSVAGFIAMALPSAEARAAGVVAAYCFGWGWTPVLFATVTVGREASAGRATGQIAAIYAAMSILGPVGGGLIAEHYGFGAVWTATAVCAAVAALLVVRTTRLHPLPQPVLPY
jgi:MFS family permease